MGILTSFIGYLFANLYIVVEILSKQIYSYDMLFKLTDYFL